MVAIVTPMREDGAIDYPAFADLIEFHVDSGTDALVPAGTTGESATLDFDEHCEVVRFAVARARGRVPVIAGTGANSTREALELTRRAQQDGADACLLVTPYYNKPTQEGLYRHHELIAREVNVPQILYNVPGRTACDMLPATVQRLSRVDGIVGIKEATGSIERGIEIMQLCGKDFSVYSGEDATAAELMSRGARGVISVTANVAPAQMHAMCEAALSGDDERARALDRKLQGLHETLFIESNPIPAKWALSEVRKIPPGIRLPLTPLSPEHHADVRASMRRAGVSP